MPRNRHRWTLRPTAIRPLAIAVVLQLAGTATALAHHGYEWLDPQFFTLNGTVEDVYFGFPHGFMIVTSDDREEWLVELSDPPGNEKAGFMADTARPGDDVRVIGHRALDPRERTMRGDTIEVHGVSYEIFPVRPGVLTPADLGGPVAALYAIQNWSVARTIRSSVYVYPLVNALHILGIALLVGGIVPLDLRMLGLFGGRTFGTLAGALVPTAAAGLVLAIGAGVLLFSVKPLSYAENPAFLTKIVLVATGTVNAVALRFTGAWRRATAGAPVASGLKVSALFSIAVWISALLAGRMIAFIH